MQSYNVQRAIEHQNFIAFEYKSCISLESEVTQVQPMAGLQNLCLTFLPQSICERHDAVVVCQSGRFSRDSAWGI
jgi:hypothetical protein